GRRPWTGWAGSWPSCAAARQHAKDAPASVAAEEAEVDARVAGGLDVVEHLERPILVVADRQPGLRPPQPGAVGVRVPIARVRDVVAVPLHPVGERELPQQVLARPLRQGCVHHLTVLAVGAVPADAGVGAAVPTLLAVVVERPAVRPAVVSRPRRVAALE